MFAILLLSGTTAHLCGHAVCVHNREPVAPGVPAGAGAQHSACKTPGEAPPGDADHDGPDDCFSCSHYVDVQVRFQITLVYTSVSAVFADNRSHLCLAPSELYHPPLDRPPQLTA